VQRIARQHNGSFHIDSTLGEGTCITLTFPIRAHQAAPPVQAEKNILSLLKSETTPSSATQKQCRILLVDDNPDVLHVHQSILKRMEHHITLAHTGEEALKRFTEIPDDFDVIVTDFLMSGMDGIDLCEHIRQQNKHIPLFLITAFGDNEKLQQAQNLNAQIIAKPITFKGLKQYIDMI